MNDPALLGILAAWAKRPADPLFPAILADRIKEVVNAPDAEIDKAVAVAKRWADATIVEWGRCTGRRGKGQALYFWRKYLLESFPVMWIDWLEGYYAREAEKYSTVVMPDTAKAGN